MQSQTQRGKARAFEGFKRWAVVTLPSESDYEEYVKKLEENPIRDTPLSVLELKGKCLLVLLICSFHGKYKFKMSLVSKYTYLLFRNFHIFSPWKMLKQWQNEAKM